MLQVRLGQLMHTSDVSWYHHCADRIGEEDVCVPV
jgi:hypothetical protein